MTIHSYKMTTNFDTFVTIKMREPKKHKKRTYISGLRLFFDIEGCGTISKKLKATLGCGVLCESEKEMKNTNLPKNMRTKKLKDMDDPVLSVGGDQCKKVREFLLKNTKLGTENIKL